MDCKEAAKKTPEEIVEIFRKCQEDRRSFEMQCAASRFSQQQYQTPR
jgi:hypothetical protein